MPSVSQIERLLQEVIGLNPASLGPSAIEAAVRARMKCCRLGKEEDYLGRLAASAAEREALIERVIVPETWFFRDEQPFRVLREHARGRLLAQPTEGVALRLLSVPCSTGEEPYSMAMSLLELGLGAERWRIDAGDVSASALAKARTGVYPESSFRGPDLAFRSRFFRSEGGGYRVIEPVRAGVHFERVNVAAADFGRGDRRYDVIFFRNLLIYLDEATQDRALARLEGLLKPGGLLFVGHSEPGLLLRRGFQPAAYPAGAFAFHKPPAGEPEDLIATRPAAPRTAQHERLSRGHRSPAFAPGPGAIGRKAPQREAATPREPGRLLPRSQRGGADAPGRETSGDTATVSRSASAETGVLLAEARQCADRGDLDRATRWCRRALQTGPRSAEAYFLMGLIQDARGAEVEAESCFRKAVYLQPGHPEALWHLALLAERRGDVAAARRLRARAARAESAAGP